MSSRNRASLGMMATNIAMTLGAQGDPRMRRLAQDNATLAQKLGQGLTIDDKGRLAVDFSTLSMDETRVIMKEINKVVRYDRTLEYTTNVTTENNYDDSNIWGGLGNLQDLIDQINARLDALEDDELTPSLSPDISYTGGDYTFDRDSSIPDTLYLGNFIMPSNAKQVLSLKTGVRGTLTMNGHGHPLEWSYLKLYAAAYDIDNNLLTSVKLGDNYFAPGSSSVDPPTDQVDASVLGGHSVENWYGLYGNGVIKEVKVYMSVSMTSKNDVGQDTITWGSAASQLQVLYTT